MELKGDSVGAGLRGVPSTLVSIQLLEGIRRQLLLRRDAWLRQHAERRVRRTYRTAPIGDVSKSQNF